MSWIKRGSSGSEPPPVAPAYSAHQQPASQPFGNQQGMYPNYPSGTPGSAQQHAQMWHMPSSQQPQYNQQYGQVYQQTYGNNANQFFQPPEQYNQNYTHQNYNNTQQSYQTGYYQTEGVPSQNFHHNKMNSEGWEDNWGWEWEDSTKQGQKPINPMASVTPQQQHSFNNATVIEESFVPTETWNWSTEDKKEQSAAKQDTSNLGQVSSIDFQEAKKSESSSEKAVIKPPHPVEEVKSLSDQDSLKELTPNLALGKRFNTDNLTPQWSIESQMSQESSDGPHTYSEGTYRSENQSRNSSKSSPVPQTDSSNINSTHPEDDYSQNSEWSLNAGEEFMLNKNMNGSSRHESRDELSQSLHKMSLVKHENAGIDMSPSNIGTEREKDNSSTMPPHPSIPPAVLPPNIMSQTDVTPVPSVSNLPHQGTSVLPPSSSSVTLPPTSNFPHLSSNTNPFKQAGPFSHKVTLRPHTPNLSQPIQGQSFPTQMSSTNLISPSVVNKVSQHNRVSLGFGANLETTPDNSERPDQPQVSVFRSAPVTQQIPENLEVAPRSDRNEYMQTAHLSTGEYGDNIDFGQNVPPPCLRRMVVGQQGSEYSTNSGMGVDEPPPGLSRMVPGQQTEGDNAYGQSGENYSERHVDGQTTDSGARTYRQADGRRTPDSFNRPSAGRGSERRPVGLDRMVPGEPGNDEYPPYQGPGYGAAGERRVVTGLDRDYSASGDAGPSDVREQDVDGSDYTERTPRSARGAREGDADASPDYGVAPEDRRREVTADGENLQDLSVITSTELAFSREQTSVGADAGFAAVDRRSDAAESSERPPSGPRRQSTHRVTSGEDSERDRTYASSPRRDRDEYKSPRDRDPEREREGRFSRGGDERYDRDPDRRSTRDDGRRERDRRENRRDREESPDRRRHRRGAGSRRYETEDTDYCSDRERDRRRYREGSHASSKPPRADRERRHEHRERGRRHDTLGRDRRPRDRDGAPHDPRYRDLDPARKLGNLRRDDERRRVTFSSGAKSSDSKEGEAFPSPPRAQSREAAASGATDEDERRRADRPRRTRPARTRTDPYYDEYGPGAYDPYSAQRQQYQYYEQLRLTNPAAYLQLYKQLLAGQPLPPPPHDYRPTPLYADGFRSLGYEGLHSGRSSANLKGNDTYYVSRGEDAALSLRTDLSDRDPNTDASLNLQLEESTVRSERMTPVKFSTAHIKGSVSVRDVVVVPAAYPVDGRPATVRVVSLRAALARDPRARRLAAAPGPLVLGVTHKKSVIEYCRRQREGAAGDGGGGAAARDPVGYALLWQLLELTIAQNGVVVGSDLAELLMKNVKEYEYQRPPVQTESGRESGELRAAAGYDLAPQEESGTADSVGGSETGAETGESMSEEEAVSRLRELLLYGNRQQAFELAVSARLWGHALQLATSGAARALLRRRVLLLLPPADPLHTLYRALGAERPPALTCVSDERWGDWRPHAAVLLANSTGRPDHDMQMLLTLGDSLSARGLPYCAQFLYLAAGERPRRHPLTPLCAGPPPPAPPRLALLLAAGGDTLHRLAGDEALLATEVYEYARALGGHPPTPDLAPYGVVMAARLADAGLYGRALAYVERAVTAVRAAPGLHSPRLIAALARLADRLQYHESGLGVEAGLTSGVDGTGNGDGDAEGGEADEGPGSGPGSPRRHWIEHIKTLAEQTQRAPPEAPGSPQLPVSVPLPVPLPVSLPVPLSVPSAGADTHHYHYGNEPMHEAHSQYVPLVEYGQHYQHQHQHQHQHYQPASELTEPPGGDDWRDQTYPDQTPHQPYGDQTLQPYGDQYWQPDYSYGEADADAGAAAAAGAGAEQARPTITMPGGARSDDRDDERPASAHRAERSAETEAGAGAGADTEATARRREGGKEGGGGWFGGILTKLALRPPNQMILPDDKNPTIVWDESRKRWRNLDGEEEESSAPPPPPRGAPLSPDSPLVAGRPPPTATTTATTTAAGGAPPTAPVPNIFKMQKSRHIKKSYVDVFNPRGETSRPATSGDPPPPAPAPAPLPAPTYFVPQSSIFDPNQTADDDRYNSGI